jgi:CheY-like chemotaxis protein
MPGPSGLEILRYIRQSQKPVKVIVITANSQAGRTAEADMADLFLLKPVRMTEVVQLANRFVRASV